MMKGTLLSTLLLAACLSTLTPCSATEQYAENWDSLRNYQAPEWYEDAKLGYWVHWGVYSVPAFGGKHAAEWYGRWMYSEADQSNDLGSDFKAHHTEKYGDPATFGYKDFIPMFKAEKFDAQEWAKLFVEGGAKYFTMMGAHHDSFCMWASKYSPWNAAAMGPKRDLVGEIAQAVRAEGLKFGVSNHIGWNYAFFIWNHVNQCDVKEAEGLYGHPTITQDMSKIRWDGKESRGSWVSKFEPHFHPSEKDFAKWKALTTELCDNYQPDLYYFDWGFNRDDYEVYRQYFGAHYYNKAMEWGKGSYGKPGVVLNYKMDAYPQGSAVQDHERGRSNTIEPMVWQTDDCVYGGNNWGYAENMPIKSANTIIDQLVDIVSKRGVLMLSLAPKADGTFPDEQKKLMRDIGAWLKICGESIYATRPWRVYGESCKDENSSSVLDVRFTRSKDNKSIYAIMLDWSDQGFVISNMKGEDIASVSLIGSDSPPTWELKEDGLHIKLKEKPAYQHAYPIKISLK